MSSWIVHRAERKKPYLARFQPKGARAVSKSFTSKRQAEQWLKVQAVDGLRGEWLDPRAGQTLFSTQAKSWMAARRSNRATTTARDESVMRSLVLPALGSLPLSAVTSERLEEWLDSLTEAGKAPATVRKAYQLAGGVLRSAVRARRIPRNPAEGVELPRMERTEQRFLTVDEIWNLADSIDSRYRLMVLLGGYAGLRLGELAALKVSSFTTGLRAVRVLETLTDVRGQVSIGPPKTKASVRVVTLPGFLVGELEEHLAAEFQFHRGKTELEDVSASTFVEAEECITGLLFPSPAGGPLRISNFRRRVWAPAVKAAGIPWCSPHALRHSQAALLIESGEHPLVVARRLGHTSVKTVLDTYGHLFSGMDEAAAEKLNQKTRTRRAPNQVVDFPKKAETQ